jgi:hypothetical protein
MEIGRFCKKNSWALCVLLDCRVVLVHFFCTQALKTVIVGVCFLLPGVCADRVIL